MKPGVGRFQQLRYLDSQQIILNTLHRYKRLRLKELKQVSGLSPTTLVKHLKALEKQGVVQREVEVEREYPHPVYYSLRPGAYGEILKLRLSRKLFDYTAIEPTDVENGVLLSNSDIRNIFSDEDLEKLEAKLDKIEECFAEINRLVKERIRSPDPGLRDELDKKLNFLYRFEALYNSLKDRLLESGVVETEEEEKRVLERELELLGRFNVTYDEFYDKPWVFTNVNKALRAFPLTRKAFEVYKELEEPIMDARLLSESLAAIAEKPPQHEPELCLVLYNNIILEDLQRGGLDKA